LVETLGGGGTAQRKDIGKGNRGHTFVRNIRTAEAEVGFDVGAKGGGEKKTEGIPRNTRNSITGPKQEYSKTGCNAIQREMQKPEEATASQGRLGA